jgi:hypothetical protein
MTWAFDGRFGHTTVDGRQREGIAWLRNPDRHLIRFHAVPQRITFDPASELPPELEQFTILEDDFRPL